MYTLEQLQKKSLKELKEIGGQLNVLLEGDRRYRKNWIDAIAGVNPPLLQLLETSLEDVLDEKLPFEEEARSIVSQYFISTALKEIRNAPPPARVFSPGQYVRIIEAVGCRNSQFCGSIGIVAEHHFNVWVWVELDGGGRKIVICSPEKLELIELVVATKQEPIALAAKTATGVEVDRVSEVIAPAAKTSPGVEVDDCVYCTSPEYSDLRNDTYRCYRCEPDEAKTSPGVEVDPVEDFLPECSNCFGDGYVEDEFGVVKFCQCKPQLSRNKTQRAIVPAAKNLPGSRSKTSTAHQLLELFKSSAHIIEDSPGVKTEATVSESAIAPAVKIFLDAESDQNPILTGTPLSDRFLARYSPPLSDRFLARYSPPQSETLHYEIADDYKADADGQLSLFEARAVTEPEPPDPDDFASIEEFREAIALWDAENPEPIAVSMDSMCEWAPCPEEWYEPKAEKGPLKASSMLEPSKVMELSPVYKSPSTSDFFIPTFGAEDDRTNGRNEPPDTGRIFARSPQPKPPNFPPQASQPTVNSQQSTTNSQLGIPKLSRNYPETIPKLFQRIAAGSSTQPARSPPGGEAFT